MKPDREMLRCLFEDKKLKPTEIAAQLSVTSATIYLWLDEYGIRKRLSRAERHAKTIEAYRCDGCGGTKSKADGVRCHACHVASLGGRKNDAILPGTKCGNPDCDNPLRKRRKQYCSYGCRTICRNIARTGERRITDTWPIGDIEYLRTHYETMGAARIAGQMGRDAEQVKNKAARLGLKMDDESWRRTVSEFATKNMLENNPMRLESCREKHSKRMKSPEGKKILAKMREGQSRFERDQPSKLEHRLRAILDGLGVEYVPSFVVKDKFVVDIKIGDLILQADGEWWHGHPRFEPLREQQIKQRARDASHDKYLRKCGYTVVRIWDRDVTPEHVRMVIENHCARKNLLFA